MRNLTAAGGASPVWRGWRAAGTIHPPERDAAYFNAQAWHRSEMTQPQSTANVSGGGQAALAGFLFQLVATLGFVAEAAATASTEATDDEYEMVFRAVRTSGLTPELCD